MADLDDRIRSSPALAVILALDQVETLNAAMAIWCAERQGRSRRRVLRAADRRIAELRRECAPAPERLVAHATAAETAQLEWERQKADGTLAPRIVTATGRGRWVGGSY